MNVFAIYLTHSITLALPYREPNMSVIWEFYHDEGSNVHSRIFRDLHQAGYRSTL